MSLQIQKLYFSYPTSHVTLFEDFSLQFYDGWTCVAGSNGCGKSTLLKLIAKLLIPDSGKISGAGIGDTSDNGIIYCPQETAEVPENLYTVFWSDDNEVRRFFSMLHVTEEMIGRYDSLSGGEKKRIQIACALADRPAVLLLDEPTNHLDIGYQYQIMNILKNQDLTVFSSIHDLNIASCYCDKIILMKAGRIVDFGTPEEMFVPEKIRNLFGVDTEVNVNPHTGRPNIVFYPQ
jgi:ABC-type cobalamin/Fe3+-siderophores transport system ATPase subunit